MFPNLFKYDFIPYDTYTTNQISSFEKSPLKGILRQRLGRRNPRNGLALPPEMHGSVPKELAKGSGGTVLALVLVHVPEGAEMRRVRDARGVRDLLHAGAGQQRPDERLGRLVLLAVVLVGGIAP